MKISSDISSAFPKARRKPLRKVAPGQILSAEQVNRWIEAIRETREQG